MNFKNIKEKYIKKINEINNIGGKVYLVGGGVRDIFLNRRLEDIDFCICNITKEDFINIFSRDSVIENINFPVAKYKNAEFSLARTEESTGYGHKDFIIKVNKNIKIEEDLKRRDITINAMAIDMEDFSCIDIFNAKEDLDKKVIKKVSDKFVEDPNRAYRAARFAALLNFKIEKETLLKMASMKENLKHINVEEVFKELKKAFSGEVPSNFFRELNNANILDVHFKEIKDLIGVIQPPDFHPEGDCFEHTMKVIDLVSKKTKNNITMYAALCHDLGKAKTPKEILPKHIDHEKRGAELVENLCNRLKVPKLYKNIALFVTLNHMRIARYNEMKVSKKIDVLDTLNKLNIDVKEIEIIINADNSMLNTDTYKRPYINYTYDLEKIYKKIDGKYIIKKYNNIDKTEFKNKLREERINYYKKNRAN